MRDLNSSNYTPLEKLVDADYKELVVSDRKRRMNDFNYNKIYRYNGGYPNKHSMRRGNALGTPGEFHAIHNEFIHTGEDQETDFKVTRHDVELFTQSKKVGKELKEKSKGWFRPAVIDNFGLRKTFFAAYYLFGFVVALFVVTNSLALVFKYRRSVQEKNIKNGTYKVSEDGVVYIGH